MLPREDAIWRHLLTDSGVCLQGKHRTETKHSRQLKFSDTSSTTSEYLNFQTGHLMKNSLSDNEPHRCC